MPNRQQTPDANEVHGVPPAAQLPASALHAAPTPNLSGITEPILQLGRALEGFDNVITDAIYQHQDDARVAGQMEYAQGKTEKEVLDSGDFYTHQGYQTMAMRSNMADWYTQANSAISDKDRELNPDDYRTRLQKQWSDVSQNIQDPVLKKYNAQLAEQYFPQLISTQVEQNNKWKQDNTITSYHNMAVAIGKTIDPNDPGANVTELKDIFKPGASLLNRELETGAQSSAVVDLLNTDNDAGYKALGGVDGMRDQGFKPEHVEAVERAFDGYNKRRGTEMAKSVTDSFADINNQAQLSQNRTAAGQQLDALHAKVQTNPMYWDTTATSLNTFDLSAALRKGHQGESDQQLAAMVNIASQPEYLSAVALLQSDHINKRTDAATMDSRVGALASKYGLSTDDVYNTMGAIREKSDRQFVDAAANVNSILAAQDAKDQKVQRGRNAFAQNTLMMLPGGEQQDAIVDQRVQLGAQAQALIQNGQLPVVAGDVRGTVNTYVEQKLAPQLAKMDVVDEEEKSADTAVLSRNYVGKDGKIDPMALAAYESLSRKANNYGFTDTQIDKYLDGDAKAIYYQAKAYDIGGTDSANALRAAYDQIHQPPAAQEYLAKEKAKVPDLVTAAVTKSLDWDNSLINRIFGNSAEGYFLMPGLTQTAGTGRHGWERDHAINDVDFKSRVVTATQTIMARNPGMTADAAVAQATTETMGRSAYVAGKLLVGGNGRTVAQDMGLDNTGEIRHENLAVIDYMRDHASLPIADGGFGPAATAFKVWGTDDNAGWLLNHTSGAVSQTAESIGAKLRGNFPFQVWYHPGSGDDAFFTFQMYDSTAHQTVVGQPMHVPAKAIGDYYKNKHKGQPSTIGAWWADGQADRVKRDAAYTEEPKEVPDFPDEQPDLFPDRMNPQHHN